MMYKKKYENRNEWKNKIVKSHVLCLQEADVLF